MTQLSRMTRIRLWWNRVRYYTFLGVELDVWLCFILFGLSVGLLVWLITEPTQLQ